MKPVYVYRILAVVFSVIGLISLMNVVTGLTIYQHFLWKSALFAVMDAAAAWGFYKRQSWLLPLFGINAAAQGALLAYKVYVGAIDTLSFSTLIGPLLALIVFTFIYLTRRLLRDSASNRMIGAVFFAAWAITFGYTIAMWLS